MSDLAAVSQFAESTAQLPVNWYLDPGIFELEQKRLFNRGPGYIGHELMVPNAGDYHSLSWMDHAKALVRNQDGVQLLSNVCRHRQAIMLQGRGNAKHIVCPIHRWTYDLRGELRGAPHFPSNPCLNLQHTPLQRWNGLLFAGPRAVARDLAGFAGVADFDFGGFMLDRVELHECDYNWKTFIEVYLEDYHVVPFHPGLGNFVTCDDLKWEFGEWASLQSVGINSRLSKAGTPVYRKWQEQVLKYTDGKLPKHGAIWMVYYPNIMIEWYPHVLVISTLVPHGPQKTTNVVEFYYPEDIVLFERDFVAAEQAAYMETAIEDDEIGLRMDRGRKALAAQGISQVGPYQSPMEDGMQHFHEFLRRELEPHLGLPSVARGARMITIEHRGRLIRVDVFGEFTLADYREFEKLAADTAQRIGKVDLMLNLLQMRGFTLDLAWEEIRFARTHPDDFERIAVVTEDQWVTWSAWISQAFVNADVQVFSDEAAALQWTEQGDPEGPSWFTLAAPRRSPVMPMTTPLFSTLISTAELARHLGDPAWAVFDCRHDLSDPDAEAHAYAAGHVPGALHLNLDRDLSGRTTGKNGRHPLPSRDALAAMLRAAGVSNDSQVVAYDAQGGIFASRLWWLLRWIGHEAVAVLDGGMNQWRRDLLPLTQDVPAPAPGNLEARAGVTSVDAAFVEARLGSKGWRLIDARNPERFRGENETLDPVGGHIPGAVNRFFKDNLDGEGRFKPAPQLRADFLALLGDSAAQDAVQVCGSGVTACHNLLAMEVAGLSGSRLYPGSWSEWCADPGRPVAR